MICCFYVLLPTHAIAYTTYGKTIVHDPNSNDPHERNMAKQIQSLDDKAIERGDTFAMASVAKRCLTQNDFQCAFKLSSLALSGSVWWGMVGDTSPVFAIHDAARDKMTEAEVRQAEQSIKDHVAAKLQKIPEEDLDKLKKEISNIELTREQMKEKAEFGSTPAMGLLSADCLKTKDYACAFKWSTLSLAGRYMWVTQQATDMLSYRDTARRHLSSEQQAELMQEVKMHLKLIGTLGK